MKVSYARTLGGDDGRPWMSRSRTEQLVLKQIELIEADYEDLARHKRDDGYGPYLAVHPSRLSSFNVGCLAFLERTVGTSNVYFSKAAAILDTRASDNSDAVDLIFGIVQAVKRDATHGFLSDLESLVHANVFSDITEMADYLLDEGYKDAAAVLFGGVLESHLRNLANRHGVLTVDQKNGTPVPRKADQINADLTKASAFGKLEQKQITAWLGLRNHAAHGEHQKYDEGQVRVFSSGLKSFISSHPA